MTDVTRDPWGIPHLRADDVLTLARLQGRVTAEDRAWQIEHQRWRMEGRTAEYLGERGVSWDRLARQVRLEQTAKECYEGLDDETRRWVVAYVDGVNDRMPQSLPGAPEIELLGLGSYAARPRPWEPWTPLGIFWAVHLLFGTFPSKLFNAHVLESLGESWLPLFHAEGGGGGVESGSNAWVVGGHRTAGGRPMIAGDPHRTIELPGCYQQVGLACDEFDVVGFCFPGVPGVQHFAHAGGVAWGITNAMADYQDLTTEELGWHQAADAPEGWRVEARGPSGWEPAELSTETILVKGAAPQRIPIVVTARGPVITGLSDDPAADAAVDAQPGPAAYSLRTPSQVTRDLGFAALLPLLRSRTVDDVAAALSRWVEPVNSALVADTSGAMRHLVVGRVARRHPDNLTRPVPAWDPRHAWDGWMANEATTVTDVSVSANDRASGGGLGTEYATPFRANRIRELLGHRTGLGADAFAAIHMDTLNGQSRLMRELVKAVDETRLSAGGRRARAELLAWDGHSDADSRGALMFSAWRHALVGWCAEHPRLAALLRPSGHSRLFGVWLDVPRQIGAAWSSMVQGGPALGIDIAEGVRAALERVAKQEDSVNVWGDRHWLDPLHSLDGVRGAPSVPQSPVSGDRGCVLAAGSAPGVTDRCYVGPVARYVWDLADRDASRWVVPLGASGVSSSRHFDDQRADWLEGRLGPVAARAGEGGRGAASAGADLR